MRIHLSKSLSSFIRLVNWPYYSGIQKGFRWAVDNQSFLLNFFIFLGADVNEKYKYHSTALIWACESGQTKIVKSLLDGGADVNIQNYYNGMTALMWAAQNGHTEIVNALLESDADVNFGDNHYRTALMFAAQQGHKEVVEALLGKGADVHKKDFNGFTALIWATFNRPTVNNIDDIIDALLANGADNQIESFNTLSDFIPEALEEIAKRKNALDTKSPFVQLLGLNASRIISGALNFSQASMLSKVSPSHNTQKADRP
jgi:ankyrin repeat protein